MLETSSSTNCLYMISCFPDNSPLLQQLTVVWHIQMCSLCSQLFFVVYQNIVALFSMCSLDVFDHDAMTPPCMSAFVIEQLPQ